jgi:hypothetical protein
MGSCAPGRRYRSPTDNGADRCGGVRWESVLSNDKCRDMMSYRDFKGVMRPGQNKRHRGRNNGGGGGGGGNNPNRPRMPHRMQTFDSNGPSVKIRGNAYQVFERYVALAREAASSGDRIAAENLYQHAEHYFRIMNADGQGQGQSLQPPRPMTPADQEMMGPDGEGEGEAEMQQPTLPPPPSEPEIPPTA